MISDKDRIDTLEKAVLQLQQQVINLNRYVAELQRPSVVYQPTVFQQPFQVGDPIDPFRATCGVAQGVAK